MLSLTYLDAMPEFIDFLFPFGRQIQAQDFHFSAFRQRTRFAHPHLGSAVPELGRSGQDFQCCYNLKSVELEREWSIRNYAVHHSFDVANSRAIWIFVKGNDLLRKRIDAATSGSKSQVASFGTIDDAFSASLATHTILCELSAENWRWYINSLDDQVQQTSRKTVLNKLAIPPLSPTLDSCPFSMRSRSNTFETVTCNESPLLNNADNPSEISPRATKRQQIAPIATYMTPDTQPLPPGFTANGPGQYQGSPDSRTYGQPGFSISDLQRLVHLEEKANGIALVLKMNISIINQLRSFYRMIIDAEGFPPQVAKNCKQTIKQFSINTEHIVDDLQLQLLRIETMLRLIADRKTLVTPWPLIGKRQLTAFSLTVF